MAERNVTDTSLLRQTSALLLKNLLLKWRRKCSTIWEWIQNLAFVLLMLILIIDGEHHFLESIERSPVEEVGSLDGFDSSRLTVGYVHSPPSIREIMKKVAGSGMIPAENFKEYGDKNEMLQAMHRNLTAAVIFEDLFHYHIRYSMSNITFPNEYLSHMGSCHASSNSCTPLRYWKSGFLSLQASIDAAIIEMTTNRSVGKNLASIRVMKMLSPVYTWRNNLHIGSCLLFINLSFVSLMYLLSLYVSRERREMREILRMMRMRDSAFWLSWALLYTVYVLIMATLLAQLTQDLVFLNSSYGLLMLLFFLYGISSMCFTFMLIALIRRPRVTAIAGFFITFFQSVLSLILFMKDLPKSIEVLLSIFPTFAFSVGITQSIYMEYDSQGLHFSDMMNDSSHVLFSYIFLIVDAVFYMMLTLYFEKILADKHGKRYELLFFLKSSFWSKGNPVSVKMEEYGSNEAPSGDFVEKVSAELLGKEAVRINQVRKTFTNLDKKVETLRGLNLNIYEGQITALLGHSGAGKTTLLNILSGMCPATGGSVSVYSYSISDMEHLEETKKRLGFCPQFDVKFDPLTVKENLKVFANIKGVPSKQVNQEVQKMISDLQMENIENVEAGKLSGGQKRKLTLAIALLGDPQILLLDEPTAGMDPCSRHHIWALLKERKVNRVTMFSTQFMDEADILADRKAVISNGRLKCVGSSLFLKRKWGIGYHLRMQVIPSCDPEQMTSIIKQHIPSAKLSMQNEEQITYTLPFENMDCFSDLFAHLDRRVGQDIVTYGVSMTTLDDVFIKLEGEAELEKGDYSVFGQDQQMADDTFSAEMEESLLLMSDSGNATLSDFPLWRQQVLASARIRYLKLKHDRKILRSIFLMFAVFILPVIVLIIFISVLPLMDSLELSPNLYFSRPRDRFHGYYTNLLVHNNTGSPIEDFVQAVQAQNIVVDVVDGEYDLNTEKYKGAIEVSRGEKGYSFQIVGNTKAISVLPVLVNIISNAFLKMCQSANLIHVWNNPIPNKDLNDLDVDYTMIVMYTMFAASLSPHFAMSSISDNKIKARCQLRLSGLFSSAYWLGQGLVDITFYCLLLYLLTALFFAFNHHIVLSFGVAMLLVVSIITYSAAMVFYVYIFAFLFGKNKTHFDSWSLFFVVSSFIPLTITDLLSKYIPGEGILYSLFFPSSSLGRILLNILFNIFESDVNNQYDYFIAIVPFIQIFLFFGILWFLEWMFGKKTIKRDPVFRTYRKKTKLKKNPEALEGPEDVLAEREKVETLLSSRCSEEKPVILVDSLRKEYKVRTGCSLLKKQRKVATRNISFHVKKGEVLGLLGPNGAGKTTSVYMLTGEEEPTAGNVELCGVGSPVSQKTDECTAFLGYCPQMSTLWPSLTVKEHLEIYAAVKGLRNEDANTAIRRVTDALELKDQLGNPAKKLSAGVSRKVCFAISMLGNPTIVLLDEPSTGLDPRGQQRLWRAIRAAFKNKDRGAILTTHYMEEAEAVCDRVAIMIAGKLRCIGSIQELKSKFGKDYLLEIKVKDPLQQLEAIHREVIRLFPHAARQDRFSSLLAYKIPKDDVGSLSHAFFLLEEGTAASSLDHTRF
ncbi:ABC-type organic anion transporter ABCA8-like isoform X2 [Bufo bufo]|uniref:ABC-type organic anion transporter ABCA8-like isoform X2 n=1 Tax=Bufo bufo TaxID=8384 RepID=UPI001ABE3AB6|nr:ABC-type organic anion transporter ABCA8-like isoform X2 [Bufo bufo]